MYTHIFYVDETFCYIENASKETIDIKIIKKVDIITYEKDNYRITAVLSISATEHNIPPFLILKG